MLWCQGAHNIGLPNRKLKYALKCTVYRITMHARSKQADRRTDAQTSWQQRDDLFYERTLTHRRVNNDDDNNNNNNNNNNNIIPGFFTTWCIKNKSAQSNLGRGPRRGAVAHVRRKVPVGYNGAPQIRPQKYPFPWTDTQTALTVSSLDSPPLRQTTSGLW